MYTKESLLEFLSKVHSPNIDYIEEPTLDPFALSDIKGVFFALDESIRKYPIDSLLTLQNISALIIKPTLDMKLLFSSDFIKKVESSRNLELIFTSSYETSVGITHISNLAMKFAPKQMHGLDTEKLFSKQIFLEDQSLNTQQVKLIYETNY